MSPDHPAQIVVIAKEPVPGRVKTRLTPPFSPEQAALLAEAALSDSLDAALATPAAQRLLALDGLPGAWLPPGWVIIPQRGGGLDERLAAAFTDAHRLRPGPVVLIGMDTPQVTPGLLAEASASWPSATPSSAQRRTADSGFSACANPTPSCSPACRCRDPRPASSSSNGSRAPG